MAQKLHDATDEINYLGLSLGDEHTVSVGGLEDLPSIQEMGDLAAYQDNDDVPDDEDEDPEDIDDSSQPETEAGTATITVSPVTAAPLKSRADAISVDPSVKVQHARKTTIISTFRAALGTWCVLTGLSDHHYKSLKEILQAHIDDAAFKDLPETVATLWRISATSLSSKRIPASDVPLPTKAVAIATSHIRNEVICLST